MTDLERCALEIAECESEREDEMALVGWADWQIERQMIEAAKTVFSSASDEWTTPADVYAALDAEFRFDFDPCPLGGDVDGRAPLLSAWAGRRVFCNPPYSDIYPFLRRWPEPEIAVYLVPARTDTRWFHEIVLPNAQEIRFIKGRLKFGGAKTGAPFPSMVIVFERRAV